MKFDGRKECGGSRRGRDQWLSSHPAKHVVQHVSRLQRLSAHGVVGLARRGAGVVGVEAPPRANQTFVADQVRNDNGTVYKQM